MYEVVDLVKKFHELAHRDKTIVGQEKFYLKLLEEEIEELVNAIEKQNFYDSETMRRANILEECADVFVIILGVLASLNIDPNVLIEAVNRKANANLTKTIDLNISHTGKIMKGPSYVPAKFDDLVNDS